MFNKSLGFFIGIFMGKIILIILCSIFMVSCSQTYTQEALKSDFDINTLKNSYSNKADKNDSIYDVFKDEELKKLISLALERNSDVLIYNNRINMAKSQVRLALANQLPSLDGGVSYSYNGNSTLSANLAASWELDLFGKYAYAKDAQLENVKIAKDNLDFFKISLISDIASGYFNIKYLQNNILLTRERIKNYSDLVSIMDIMYKKGLISFSDFLENKADLQQEQQSLNTLLNELEEQKNDLRVLINDNNYDFGKEEQYDFSMPNLHINLDSSADIILNRPDIKADISSLNAAVYNLNSAKAQLYPTINVSGSLGKALLSPASFVYQILSSITLPLFSRFEIYENIKLSDYTRLEAYYTLQKGVNTALGEIENAIYALDTDKKTLQISNEMLKQNEETLDLLKNSRNLGLIDDVEYLTALNNHLLMMQNNNTSYYNTISATIYLYRSVGGNKEDILDNTANKNLSQNNKTSDVESKNINNLASRNENAK